MQGSSSNKAREEKPEVELERKATQSTKKCLENEGMAFERKPGTTRLSDGNLSDERQKLSLSYSLSLCDALA